MKTPLFLLFLVATAAAAIAAPLPVAFRTVSSFEGLPQNTARVLLQDKNGYVWVGTEDGLVRFDGYDMYPFRRQHGNLETLSDNYISALAEGRKGRIWVGTMGGGLNSLDPETGRVQRLKQLGKADIFSIVVDTDSDSLWLGTDSGLYHLSNRSIATGDIDPGIRVSPVPLLLADGSILEKRVSGIVLQGEELWLSTRGQGIGLYNLKTKEVVWYVSGDSGLEDSTFNTLVADSQGGIWAGGQNRGLVRIIREGGQVRFQHYNTDNSGLAANDVMAITDADGGKLWVGTWGGGLALLNPGDGEVDLYRPDPADPNSFKSDIVIDLLRSRDGQVWVGTFDHGVSWFDPDPPFLAFRARPDEPGGLPGNLIWSFAEQSDGRLWIGSSKGLARLNLKSNEYEPPKSVHPEELWAAVAKDDIRAMLVDGDLLWIAARRSGLVRLDLASGVLTPITELLASGQALSHPYIRLIIKDSQGYLWLGASKGLNRFDPVSGLNRVYLPKADDSLSLPHYRLRALYEDSRGQIWAGTSRGLLRIDREGNPVEVWRYDSPNSKTGQLLAGSGVRGVSEDQQGRLWVATEGGLSVYDRQGAKIRILREEDGLPSNSAYSVIPSGHYMWVSTLRGLARIDVRNFRIERYLNSDGLPDNEFNFNAWQKLSDGRLAFGTLSGFTIFAPQTVPGPERSGLVPPLRLQTYVSQDENSGKLVIRKSGPVEVGWQNNSIDFRYGALNYGAHGTVRYESYLKGVNRDWVSVGKQRQVSYSGLAPGHYVFQVRAKDSHGQWKVESKPVSFVVIAPPWRTTGAIAGYILLLVSALFAGTYFYNCSLRSRAENFRNLVAERTAELEASGLLLESKNRQLDRLLVTREHLFRAVSHEIRTPLAVISSVLESVQRLEPGAGAKVPMARYNARRLGHLLTNILDHSCDGAEQEAGSTFLVQPALTEAMIPYILQAETEGKVLTVGQLTTDAWLCLPRDTFLMLVSNLLSNACKYTQRGDTISVQPEMDGVSFFLKVQDSGCGIPAGGEEQIFEWFNRGGNSMDTQGWGIGLAFVREAVEAASGAIELEASGAGIGAHFLLTIPLGEDGHFGEDRGALAMDFSSGQNVSDDSIKASTILFIEDDPDLLQLLPTLFPEHWTCLVAESAEKGWALACDSLPDLVVTDLMLPGESGFDFTRRLKEDYRTAHIPVIILTASGGEEQRLTGLGLSADSFMEKPFDNKELLLRVQGLIANRERVFQRVERQLTSLDTKAETESIQAGEDEFLHKLQATFPETSQLVSTSLEDVAGELAMSTRAIQREMQRLGISWREYKKLRIIGMAMDLLRDPRNRIGMVAEATGYNSAAHFSKIFKQHTGSSPTEWRRRQGDKTES